MSMFYNFLIFLDYNKQSVKDICIVTDGRARCKRAPLLDEVGK